MRLLSDSPARRLWLTLVLAHLVTVAAVFALPVPRDWTLIGVATVYLPLLPLEALGWPVTTRDQWPIAPPSALGWGLVVGGWALVHALLARGLVAVWRRARRRAGA